MLVAATIAAGAATLYAWMVYGDHRRAKAGRERWLQNIGR